MSDINVYKKDEVYAKINCEKYIARELSEYFTFFVPGYQFTPQYKSRVWDGKIRLADLRTFTIYRGLLPYIEKIRETLSNNFSDFTDVFIVDSTPIEICKISRANRSAICATDEIKPSFGLPSFLIH